MRNKRAKELRKFLFEKGHAIIAEPYKKLNSGQIIASEGRRLYKEMKRNWIVLNNP